MKFCGPFLVHNKRSCVILSPLRFQSVHIFRLSIFSMYSHTYFTTFFCRNPPALDITHCIISSYKLILPMTSSVTNSAVIPPSSILPLGNSILLEHRLLHSFRSIRNFVFGYRAPVLETNSAPCTNPRIKLKSTTTPSVVNWLFHGSCRFSSCIVAYPFFALHNSR